MFYKPDRDKALSRSEMEQVRRAFRGKLVRMRFNPQFILDNCDELLAIAHAEYVRCLDKGVEIEEPVSWMIHCAWRRTQNLLTLQGYQPRLVSTEKRPELAAEDTMTPEELALQDDRARKIREVVAKLSEDQRRVVALIYLEGMSLREVQRHLGWSHGKSQRCHEAALREIRRRLPVRSSDELEVDLGVAAWLSLAGAAGAHHLPAGFEAALEKAEHGASGLWARAQELARRFTVGGGSEAAGAVASSGAGRAVGACAAGVTIACLAGGASGLIGPGIGAIGSPGGQHHLSRSGKREQVDRIQAPSAAPTAEPAGAGSTTGSSSRSAASQAARKAAARAREATPKAEAQRVRNQTEALSRVANESIVEPSAASASSGQGATEVVTVSPTASGTTAAQQKNNSRVAAQTSGIARAGG